MGSAKRTPREVWGAIEKQARAEEIERFLALTPAEVDARLRARGEDPAAIRAEGEAFVKKLSADLARLAGEADEDRRIAGEPADPEEEKE